MIRVGNSTYLTADHSATSEWGIVFNNVGLIFGNPISEAPGRTTWQVFGNQAGTYPVTIAAKCHGGNEVSYTATIQVDPTSVALSTVAAEPPATPVAYSEGLINTVIYEATPVVAVIVATPNVVATPAPDTGTATTANVSTPTATATFTPVPSPSDPEDKPVVMVNPEGPDPDLEGITDSDIVDAPTIDVPSTDQDSSVASSGTSWLMIILWIWLWSLVALLLAALIYLIWKRRQPFNHVFAYINQRRTQDDPIEDDPIEHEAMIVGDDHEDNVGDRLVIDHRISPDSKR